MIVVGLSPLLSYRKLSENELLTLAKGLVAHEVGHHRFTSFTPKVEEVMKNEVLCCLLNIAEDERVERKMVVEFPKLKKNFKGLHQFFASIKDFYTTEANLFRLLLERRWKRWGIPPTPIPTFLSNYGDVKKWVEEWEELLEKVVKAPSTEEVVDIVKEFYERWKELLEENIKDGYSPSSTKGLISPSLPTSQEEMDKMIKELEEKYGTSSSSSDEEGKGKENGEDGKEENDKELEEAFFRPSPISSTWALTPRPL